MKKLIPLTILVSILFSCDDEEKEEMKIFTNPAPTIELVGNQKDTISLNTKYVDEGATAKDHNDEDITSSIVTQGVVNENYAGEYNIGYYARDAEGQPSARVVRTVLVNNDAEILEGVYTVTHRIGTSTSPVHSTYQTQISESKTINNQILISKVDPITDTIEALITSRYYLSVIAGTDSNNVNYSGSGSKFSNADIFNLIIQTNNPSFSNNYLRIVK